MIQKSTWIQHLITRDNLNCLMQFRKLSAGVEISQYDFVVLEKIFFPAILA
jgi:hypothetical protein